MLIIAGGVALGGLAVIYRKPIAVGFLGLIGFAVLLALGLWFTNTFAGQVTQLLIRLGWADTRAYEGEIWWLIALLWSASVLGGVLGLIGERQLPGGLGRMQRLRKARSVAKGAAAYLAHLADDPLENYARAQSYVATLSQYLSTLPPNEAAYAVLAPVVEQGKAVVGACERALRLERIADALKSIAIRESFEARLAATNEADDDDYMARQRTPAGQAQRAKFDAMDRATIAAAKTGPITWNIDKSYTGSDGKGHYYGPRGMGLTVALVAAAEAELDGFARPEPELPNDDGRNGNRWSAAFHQRMAMAANRVLAA